MKKSLHLQVFLNGRPPNEGLVGFSFLFLLSFISGCLYTSCILCSFVLLLIYQKKKKMFECNASMDIYGFVLWNLPHRSNICAYVMLLSLSFLSILDGPSNLVEFLDRIGREVGAPFFTFFFLGVQC